MAIDEKELMRLKDKIEKARSKLDQATGQKEYLLQQLRRDWGCQSYAEARQKYNELLAQYNELQAQIDEKLQTIGDKYEL
jgi:flagellar biosynthesis chaperone FliJ